MNIKYIIISFAILCGLILSCKGKDDTPQIEPSGLVDISSSPKPGQIILRWKLNKTDNSDLKYIKFSYFDPLIKKDIVCLASSYTDSLILNNTRAGYGKYHISIQPFSSTDKGGEIYKLEALSGKAPVDTLFSEAPITLTAKQLSTNAQEPTEGPLANLLDGNDNTYFHSMWSDNGEALWPHYIEVNLNRDISALIISYKNRKSGNGKPNEILIQVSKNGKDWVDWQKLSNLPSQSGSDYTSPKLIAKENFSFIKMIVLKCKNTGDKFFSMAELKLTEVKMKLNDPEANLK